MPTLFDHVVVGLIAVALPLYDLLLWYPRMMRASGRTAGRMRLRSYTESMLFEWGLVAITVAVWIAHSRSLDALGLGFSPSWGFALALALALGFIAFGTSQRLEVRTGTNELRSEVRDQLHHLRPLLPHTRRELTRFSALSITAGICEEILYRGFLIWYLSLLIPQVAAWIIAALLFGMAHAYQGTRGVGQTAAIGLGMVLLYVLSGSLWVPMLVHAFVDLNVGFLAYDLLRTSMGGKTPAAPDTL